jgi:hypothetical protein
MDPQIQLLLEILDAAFDKPSWHGPNLASSFRGVDAQTAARSIRGRKSIWQQVLHAAYWKQRVLNKLIGTEPFPRPGTDWPKLPVKPTARAWKDDQLLLHDIHQRLRAAVSKCRWRTLDSKLRRMIYGAAAHDVNHAGQIRLLRRLLHSHRPS